MSDLDLEALRAWVATPIHPSVEVREHARARLEQSYDLPLAPAPTTSKAPGRAKLGKRLAIAALAALVLLAGTVVWVQREIDDRFSRLKTVAVPKDSLGGGEIGSGPVNVLLVGSDKRIGADATAFGTPDEIPGQRSDTIILLRIENGQVNALWIPRDLMLGDTQINGTFNEGPAGLIDAIKTGLGVTVDHYVEVGFTGFPRIVDELGGVSISSPGRARDQYTGLDLPAAGCVSLDGTQALQWVRSRHLEVLENGVWTDASPRADLDRQVRQQEFVRALARTAHDETSGDPIAALHLADAIIPAVTVDQAFSRGEIVDLVRILARVEPDALQLATVPVVAAPDGAHVVLGPDADQALAPFRGRPATPPAPPTTPTAPATPAC